MNPGAYGSPQAALFASTGMGASFMDPFGNIHSAGPALAADSFHHGGGATLFGAPAAPAAALFYSPPPPPPATSIGLVQAVPLQLQLPLPAAGAGAAAAGGAAEEIRTVFVSGFPADVKERELHNLLRFMPGYEASQMNWKTGGPQGFALFATAAHARAVVDVLSGLQFDEGVAIRAEMAHKNMFLKPEDPSVKRANRSSPPMLPGPTMAIVAPVAQLGGGLAAAAPPPLSPAAPPAFLAAAAAAAAAAAGSPPVHMGPGILSPLPLRPTSFSPVTNLRDNPPCNTLFIGNLGDNTSEQELRALLSTQPGYRQLKMVRGPKSTTAFVEFADLGSAMAVHTMLQGAVLASSDRGGIRVQYSKNPFGRRDVMGASPQSALASPPEGDGGSGGGSGGGLLGGVGAHAGFIGQAGLDTVLGPDA